MSPEKLAKLVAGEIAVAGGRYSSPAFLELLVSPPCVEEYSSENGVPWPLFTVLREPLDGYCVVYDFEQDRFGLAIQGVVVSMVGGLIECLDSM